MTNLEILSLAIWYFLIYDIRYVYHIRKYWYGHLPAEEFREIAIKSARPFDCYPCAVFWTQFVIEFFNKSHNEITSITFCFGMYLIASIIEKITRL